MNDSPGYLTQTVQTSIGWDLEGLAKELEDLPKKIFRLREKIAPLKAELALLKSRFDSKGRSPSHFDIRRSLLLSELKEEARVTYYRDPETRTDSKGREVRIELTDGRAEDIAHAHPRYRKFVDEAEAEQRRMAEINRELSPLFDKIEAWKGRREYLVQRLEISKALVYAWSASSKLA